MDEVETRLTHGIQRIIKERQHHIEKLIKDVSAFNPQNRIALHRHKMDTAINSLYKNFSHLIALKKKGFHGVIEKLDSLSPLSILSRGYSITYKLPEQSIVKTSADVQNGDQVEVRLHEGTLTCRVDLQKEFSGIQGYSKDNLWRMRKFYIHYKNNEKLAPMVQEIGWAQNIFIMERCGDDLEREFYIRMTLKYGWTKNVLLHQIDNRTYEKTLLNQTNFDKALPEKIKNQVRLAVKDEYTFDFLELGDEHSEIELERTLMNKINRFLIEMGGAFTFAGNQFRLEIDGNEFFIDILLYHRRLKCLLAVELKSGKFLPEYDSVRAAGGDN